MGLGEAIVLGLVQGLTEFLPVSSSAHLRIVGELHRLGATPARRSPRSPRSAPRPPCSSTSGATSRGSARAWWRAVRGDHGTDWRSRAGMPAGGRDHDALHGVVHRARLACRSSSSACCSRTRSSSTFRNLWLIALTLAGLRPRARLGRPASGAKQRDARPSSTARHAVAVRVLAGARADPGRLPLGRHDHRRAAAWATPARPPRGTRSCWRSPRCSAPGCSSCVTSVGDFGSAGTPGVRGDARRDARRVRRRLRRDHRVPARSSRRYSYQPFVVLPARARGARRGAAAHAACCEPPPAPPA